MDTKVVLKAQHPSGVEGAHDHPSWNRLSLEHIRFYGRQSILKDLVNMIDV